MKDTRAATIRFRLLKLSDNNVAQPLSPMVHPTASTTSQDGQPGRGRTRGRGAGLGHAGMMMSETAKNFHPDAVRVRA